jgi:hypothetical protein
MSENKRSFWASVPGLVTGLAGLLTGIVGLITLLVQLNVIGGDKSKTVATTATTVAGSPTTVQGGGGTTVTTEAGRFTVNPSQVKLQPSEREKPVVVTNASTTATITMLQPEITGTDKGVFKTDAGCTNVPLKPGASCTVKVLFSPSGPLKTYGAALVLNAEGARSLTLPIEASSLL